MAAPKFTRSIAAAQSDGDARQEDSLLPGHTPVTLYPTFKGIKGQRPKGTGYRARRRRYLPTSQAIPASPITNVEGSGTATGLARRKPMLPSSNDGASVILTEDDKANAKPSLQSPPRSPRDEPEAASPSRSFHW